MKINLKINKKIGIILVSLITISATSNYYSVISKNNKYEYAYAIPKEITSVGSVVLRLDDMNPTEVYGGTWELITGDATLKFGDGTEQNLNINGSNEKTVSLPEHSHGMVHSHQKGSMNITGQISAPGYQNTSVGYSLSGTGAFSNYGALTVIDKVNHNGQMGSAYRSVYFNAKNSWTGSTSVPYVNGTTTNKENTDLTGENEPLLNVQESFIYVNVWKRIS